jgi:hypothetical protein
VAVLRDAELWRRPPPASSPAAAAAELAARRAQLNEVNGRHLVGRCRLKPVSAGTE